jgi:CubicO group peptidase (beta-lactamase class C family)
MTFRFKNCLIFLFSLSFLACRTNPGKNKKEKISYIMNQAFADKAFVGNVLVAEKGEIVYQNSFGKASANIKNTDTTQFLIASLSKPITAIIILRLAEKGLIKPHEPISNFIKPDNAEVGKITIHQLLTHSSGISEFINKDTDFDFNHAFQLAKFNFPSGSSFEYSNSGYVLLIKVAEKVTGKKYDELIKN